MISSRCSSDSPAGVALIGNEGVGKTTLAGQVAEGLGRGEPVWVVGTLAQSSVPFGAFGPLLEIQDAGKPAALLQSAADSLLAHADSAPIIVDNARLLDLLFHLPVGTIDRRARPKIRDAAHIAVAALTLALTLNQIGRAHV